MHAGLHALLEAWMVELAGSGRLRGTRGHYVDGSRGAGRARNL